MTNPLQEKIVKEFEVKFPAPSFCCHGDMCLDDCGEGFQKDLEAWLITTLEEVYKAGKEEGNKQGFSNGMESARTMQGQRSGFELDNGTKGESASTNVGNLSGNPEKWRFTIDDIEEEKEKSFKEGEKNGLLRAVEAVKKIREPNRENPKSIRVAAALGKEETRKGPIACARSDGYEVACEEIIKAIESLN